MCAARYVGRVGGLAVALGVGGAILTGTAVAGADDGTSGSSSSSESSPSTASPPSTAGSASRERAVPLSRGPSSTGTGAGTTTVSTRAEVRDHTTRAKKSKRGPTAAESGARRENPGEDGKGRNEKSTAKDGAAPNDGAATDQPGSAARGGGQSGTGAATVSSVDVSEPAQKAVAHTQRTGGDAPSTDSPAAWTLAAAARRELGGDKIGYSATVDVDNGVITGTNNGFISDNGPTELSYTVVGKTQSGGKVTMDETTGDFTFLPYTDNAAPGGTDRFRVLVAEQTALDRLLEQNQFVKGIVQPFLVRLHQIPIVNVLLSPIIGRSKIVGVDIDVDALAAEYQNPIAFTTTVVSFDGTPISVNYFPKVGLVEGERAPTILNGPSLATAGYTDPNQETTVFGLVPGLKPLRAEGYNVITWDPRGEYASGGRLHLDSEDFEARDVSAIISWMSGLSSTEMDRGTVGSSDPLIGMVGGSYGGGIQLTSAGIDTRIDAIAPGIAWNTLNGALYPNDAFKTSWASLLLLSLVVSGSRLDPEIYAGIGTGVLFGFLTPRQQDFLSRNSPATVVENISVPTLFLQGTVDTLFPLQQALLNAEALGEQVPVKMIWYCGGHGQCLTLTQDQLDEQTDFLVDETLAWMDTYVMDQQPGPPPPVAGAKFEWVDQDGNWYASNDLPLNQDADDFDGPSISSGDGGFLPILPIIGGSGPQTKATFPVSLTLGAESKHALNVAVPGVTQTTHIVGAPQLTFTYSGLGTSRTIYAQLVDDNTHLVLGNIVTPVPVKLDGRTHQVTVSMENIAYTMDADDSLTLQIIDSASAYEDFTAFGVIKVSDIGLEMPTASSAVRINQPSTAGLSATA